jgi:hypothetical protein
MAICGLFLGTIYITPFDHDFRMAVDLQVIYFRKVALFTKSAFCKELYFDKSYKG